MIPDLVQKRAVYVAESAATVKRVDLDSGEITHVYRGPGAPLTSLCLSQDGTRLFAGSWDKLVWSWDVASCAFISSFQGHTDFVKTVLFLRTANGQDILVSGGAEGDVLIWSVETGARLGCVKGHSHAVQDVVVDPWHENIRLFTAFSDPGIKQLALPDLDDPRNAAFSAPISAHETSTYKLDFDSEGDLWTASADKSAKHLVRADGWKADTTLVHPDFVKDVVVHERYGWVITACRDEEVRVWNISTGELHHTFSGHFEEVTGLCVVEDKVISVSIDATIRQWSLDPKQLQKAKEEAQKPQTAEDHLERGKKVDDASLLTEEEERELVELMANEESELQDLMAADRQ